MASYLGTPSVASSASSVVNVSVDDGGSGMVVTGSDALEVEGELIVPSATTSSDGAEVGDANTALKETLKKTLMQSNAWGEPESVTRLHLEYLHLQILSVVTGSQLSRIFEKRTNFDLRRLLDGTERFLHSLLTQLELDMGMITSSLNVVRIDPLIRAKVAEVMVPPKDLKDTLYILLLAENRVVTLVRPKKHSVHPADLHILLNTLSRSSLSSVTGPDASTWLPICLPKFNPNGFLHTYVSFLVEPETHSLEGDKAKRPALVEQKTKPLFVATPKSDETGRGEEPSEGSPNKDASGEEAKAVEDLTSPVDISSDAQVSILQSVSSGPGDTSSRQSLKEGREDRGSIDSTRAPTAGALAPKVSLAIVTADREGFEKVRDWASKVINTLTTKGLIAPVFSAAKTQDIVCSSLGIPGLRHFIYKSRSHVQLVVPGWEDPYVDADEKRRLITLYQIVHDAVHARSGQPGGPLKLYFVKTEKECMLGWVTTPFELFITTSPKLPKSAVVSAANAVSRWVKKHEGELVLRDAPVF
ncbi:Vacuolar fusion protein mon1 [Tulasnella sp. 427]|nr:Vacuolar fusion protein mon1 [Tulasnella sp. 427]